MSLPLRFKAVCTEMGKEYHLPDLYLAFTPTQPKGSGMCFGLFHEEIDGFLFKKMPEICQSTGLHDIRGQEVFFGDVLINVGHDTGLWEMCFHDLSAAFYLHNSEADENDTSFKVRDMIIIGNRWMPADELKRRAEAAKID